MRIPRLRFGMRTVIVAMTATALAVCFVVSPVYRALAGRRGSQRLLAVGAELEHSIYLKRDYDPVDSQTQAPSSAPLPTWLATLAGDAAKLRPDAEVFEVWTQDDAQVQALCDHGELFTQLQVVDLWSGNISPSQVARFQASLPKFPKAVDFHFHCSIPAGLLSSLNQAKSIFLWGPGTSLQPLDGSRVKELATLDNLHLLWIKRYPMKFEEAIHLADCKGLRRLYLSDTGMSADDFSRLRAAMPNCEIEEQHPLKLSQPAPPPNVADTSPDGFSW